MPKICVKSPEVVSNAWLNIHAQVSITTKAKLDSIAVKGSCACADVPPPIIDVVCLMDGSDSYNNKVTIGGKLEAGDAFEQTGRFIDEELVPGLQQALGDRISFTLVQFSGVKQLEKGYRVGSAGATGTSGLNHYNIEFGPKKLKGQRTDFENLEGLDGNGQLFLALQDLNMDNFLNDLPYFKMTKDQKRQRIIIAFCDEEWDIKHLDNAFGSGKATPESVTKVNNSNYETFAVIVRPNKSGDQNTDFIEKHLCGGKTSNYKKVYTENFDVDIKAAIRSIISDLKDRR